MAWRGHGTSKYGTWNVRSLLVKDLELMEEIIVTMLAIAETEKK